MSKPKVAAEGVGSITYFISATEQIEVTSNMSIGEVAALQQEYWAKMAGMPINRQQAVVLPGEAARMAEASSKKTRFTDKAYLRFK